MGRDDLARVEAYNELHQEPIPASWPSPRAQWDLREYYASLDVDNVLGQASGYWAEYHVACTLTQWIDDPPGRPHWATTPPPELGRALGEKTAALVFPLLTKARQWQVSGPLRREGPQTVFNAPARPNGEHWVGYYRLVRWSDSW